MGFFPRYSGPKADSYFPDVNPSIRNSFATAAYRFGHSMIEETVRMRDPHDHDKVVHSYRLRNNFFNSTTYKVRDGQGMTETIVSSNCIRSKLLGRKF